ncbi:MAG: hypothetical protein PVI59_11110 [Anaerolineae bacterium]|jgi:hypothetical protein
MKERTRAGAIISLVGALVGIAGVFAAFLLAYQPMIDVELAAGRPDEAIIVRYVIPFLSDIGIIAGVLWAVAAYGFFKQERWAWTAAFTANVISLLTGFFGMIPALSRGLFPTFLIVFAPNLVTYLLLLTTVRRVEWKIILLSFFSGITYVLAFMNGVATTDKIILTGKSFLIAVQRINWVAAATWAVFTVALVLRKRWAKPVGLGAGLMTLIAGVPLAVYSTIQEGRFSMFSPAPLLALALLLFLLVPAGSRMVTSWLESKSKTNPATA